jgi:hypothetical protein
VLARVASAGVTVGTLDAQAAKRTGIRAGSRARIKVNLKTVFNFK